MVRVHISRDRHITEVYYIYAPLRLMQSITSFSLTPTIVPSPQLTGKCRVVVTSLCSTDQSASTRASFGCGLVAEFSVSAVEAWRLGAPLPERAEAADKDAPLSGLSPMCTRITAAYNSPRRELRVKDVKAGTTIAKLLPQDRRIGASRPGAS